MGFKVAVIYFSRRGRLVTLTNVIAEGARQVQGAEVTVYRVRDAVGGDCDEAFEEGVLDAPVIQPQDLLEADAIIIGAPGRQGGMCAEVRFFLDQLADFQTTPNPGSSGQSYGLLKGKVGSAFTSVGGQGRGYGGHEAILMSFHSTFLQHGMLVAGVPPTPVMEDALMASPFGTCMAGKARTVDCNGVSKLRSLSESEVKLAYAQGEWVAQIAKQLHDSDGD
mmetsp:Transcript_64137/g.202917  ORF Transcript_64137/g.202917 Transcript_64137/m.202917 type:complete len:222 (+) Transcript_64137:272-937(+)